MSLFFSNKAENNKGIWIIDNWSTGYFHWFSDAIPRLWAARKYINDHHVLLPNEYKNIRYVIDSLDILNIQFSFFNPLKKVSVKSLLLPGHIGGTGHFNSHIMREIRNEFLKSSSKTRVFRRIYVSRRKANFRRLLNEADLEDLLKDFGFETRVLEDLNLLDQIQLFSETAIALGPHGAGLTNMLFMRTNSKIIELRGDKDSHNNCYFSLASAMELDYYYITCKTTSSCIQKTDLTVDLQKMRKLLELLIPIGVQ
jgi:capsular polysaccharide biosynthesis protein